MKLLKEELKKKINEMPIDDESKITLLEDIEDSFVDNAENVESEELETLKAKYEELKEKYKARFFDSDSDIKEEEQKKEEITEIDEIDVKEI